MLYIANTDFEVELSEKKKLPIEKSLAHHPIFFQLQFLPIFYTNPSDTVVVTHLPDLAFLKKTPLPLPSFITFDQAPPKEDLDLWGYSQKIQTWADKFSLKTSFPKGEVVKKIHSKLFFFTHIRKLPNATLLHTEKELQKWAASSPFPKVVKGAYGAAGNSRLLLFSEKDLDPNRVKNFSLSHGFPLLGEPWVDRVLDFSSQWKITKEGMIHKLGVTRIENSPKGVYKKTFVGPKSFLFQNFTSFIEEHLSYSRPLLEKIVSLGFWGNLGIDAMVYKWKETLYLQPIVEINARKTMSWVALEAKKKLQIETPFCFSYEAREENQKEFLPSCLGEKRFDKQIAISTPIAL